MLFSTLTDAGNFYHTYSVDPDGVYRCRTTSELLGKTIVDEIGVIDAQEIQRELLFAELSNHQRQNLESLGFVVPLTTIEEELIAAEMELAYIVMKGSGMLSRFTGDNAREAAINHALSGIVVE